MIDNQYFIDIIDAINAIKYHKMALSNAEIMQKIGKSERLLYNLKSGKSLNT